MEQVSASAETSPNGAPPAPEGTREASRDAPIGGQAVLEGVMMRGVSTWAVAVRQPTLEQLAEGGPDSKEGAKGEIEVISEPLVAWSQRSKLLRLPVVRGVVALGESLKIGFHALASRPTRRSRPTTRERSRRSAVARGRARSYSRCCSRSGCSSSCRRA